MTILFLSAWIPLGYRFGYNRIGTSIVKFLLGVLLLLTAIAIFTGLAGTGPHGLVSTLLVPATILIVPLVTGYVMRGQSRLGSIMQGIVGGGHILATIVAAFTGTLPASTAMSIGEETANRFVFLHMIALPVLLAFFLGQSCWKVFASDRSRFIERPELEPAAPGSSNPYDAPRS